jgi:hypothetical protein
VFIAYFVIALAFIFGVCFLQIVETGSGKQVWQRTDYVKALGVHTWLSIDRWNHRVAFCSFLGPQIVMSFKFEMKVEIEHMDSVFVLCPSAAA